MSAIRILSGFFTQGPERVPGSPSVPKTALSGGSGEIGNGRSPADRSGRQKFWLRRGCRAGCALMFALLLLPVAGESLAQTTTIELELSTDTVLEYTITEITITAKYPEGSTAPATATTVAMTVASGVMDNIATGGGTVGNENVDYKAIDAFEITIPAAMTSMTGVITFTAAGDVLDDDGETVHINGVSSGFTIAPAVLTINDDPSFPTTIDLSLSTNYVPENAETEIMVTAAFPEGSRTLTADAVVTVDVEAGSATVSTDFTAVPDVVLTIPMGMSSGTGSFTLTTADDTDAESGGETLTLSSTAAVPSVFGVTISTVTLTIVDDDSDPTMILISLDPDSVTESNDITTITATAAFPPGSVALTSAAATNVVFTVGDDGTATASVTGTAGDFEVAETTFTVIIPASGTEGTGSIDLTVNDDTMLELPPETITFTPTAITGFTFVPATALTVEIEDNDAQADTITLILDPESVDEGTTTAITVTASIPEFTATGADILVTVMLATGDDAGTAIPSVAADAESETAAVLGDFDPMITFPVITITAGMLTGSGTFMLTAVDNADEEENKTLVFSATAITGYAIVNATLTIENSDGGGASASMEAVLPELARASVTSVIDVLSGRIAQVASGSLGDGSVSFAGHSSLAQALAANQQGLNDGDLSLLEALGGSSIALELDGTGTTAPSAGGQAGSSGVGVWASANYDRISSKAEGLGDWDGSQFSLFVGVDGHVSKNTVIGVAASWSKGSTEFDNNSTLDIDTGLLGLNPYIGWHSADGKKTAWGTVGYSTGDFEQDQQNNLKTDLKMTVLAVGGSTRIAKRAGFDFDIKGDLSTAELSTDAVDMMPEVKSKAHRARVAVEAEVNKASDSGAHVMRSVALGLRYDGGDGDTGSGLELDGGLDWSGRSLSVSGAANVLLFHTGDLKEWGVGGLIRYAPSHAKGRNLTFRAQPSYGRGESGSGQLWDQQVKDLDEDGREPEARLVMDAGWGLAALSGRGLVTPYSGLELSEGGSRVYRLGSRVAVDSVFNIDLAAHRTEDGDSPEHGIGLQLGMQW